MATNMAALRPIAAPAELAKENPSNKASPVTITKTGATTAASTNSSFAANMSL